MAPEFYIDHADWTKVLHYARARAGQKIEVGKITKVLNHEIGGMMIAKLDKDKDWVLQHPVILKQETAGSNCTLDKTALADYYIEMTQKYGRDIQFVWWHSHANMGAFWSGTDTNTMKEYASGQWSMFLVVNVKGEYKFRVQMWEPIEAGEDIELGFINSPDNTVPKNITEEVNAKCSEETYTTYNGSWKQRHYDNGSQLSLGAGYDSYPDIMAEKEEMKAYNSGFGVYDDDELACDYAIKKIDQLNTKLCSGEIKHKAYRKAIKQLNTKMEKGNYDYRINLPESNDQLDSLVQVSFAWDMIVDKDTGQSIGPASGYGVMGCV